MTEMEEIHTEEQQEMGEEVSEKHTYSFVAFLSGFTFFCVSPMPWLH